MVTFVILCIIATALEVSRLYFICYKYSEAGFDAWKIVPGLCMIGSMVGSYYLRDWISIITWMLAIIVSLLILLVECHIERMQKDYHPSYEPMTSREKKQVAAFFFSFLIPLVMIVPITFVTIKDDDKAFEEKWKQTTPLTIGCKPIKTIVNGNETVVLECTGLKDDISFSVNTYGFDVLKLEENDKIKYLKAGKREKFEIVTLKGEEYDK